VAASLGLGTDYGLKMSTTLWLGSNIDRGVCVQFVLSVFSWF